MQPVQISWFSQKTLKFRWITEPEITGFPIIPRSLMNLDANLTGAKLV